ncbi:SDR family NAD(P)-dependent oxidoreductase [Geodermatophilus sp. URMC 62]|uniref:SDR family NAD(P)-dependent oxidoreductase n=1 Tax=Geodermatophilus sp. URMC 62 TaxID=3423414 RepID=UPI00406C0857
MRTVLGSVSTCRALPGLETDHERHERSRRGGRGRHRGRVRHRAGHRRQVRAAGMQVVIADVEEGALRRVSSEPGALGVRTDVRDAASVQALADATIAEHGAVHVVVNNAGVGAMAPIADLKPSDWEWMLQVDLWGVIHGVHSFLPLLRKNADGGHIVNTASIGGLVPGPGLGAHDVTEYGIVALTETLAVELAAEGSPAGTSVLLPGTVRTGIGNSTRNRPADVGDGAGGQRNGDLRRKAEVPVRCRSAIR